METAITLFWFRRDLRLEDNAGLYHALKSGNKVLPIFIFDTTILNKLEDREDARVSFIYRELNKLKVALENHGSTLDVWHGSPEEVWKKIIEKYTVKSVFMNRDYEPNAIQRDQRIAQLLKEKGITFHSCKDQCIFEYTEVLKDDGKPYTIFTPYSRKWKSLLSEFYLKSYPNERYFDRFLKINPIPMMSIEEIGFAPSKQEYPSAAIQEDVIKKYKLQRDFPAIYGTTRLSVHLRFGTVSIRKLAQKAVQLDETWLNELIWRDFYMMILGHFPQVTSQSFKREYDRIQWRNNEKEFLLWCKGETGYPIVDAGMRELNTTGFMHNRVRMIVASFLVKHLLIDWRWGEAYFAQKLLDFDLSANNGGWQWAAGSGCDAAPYFRVFNPTLQTEKFDKNLAYIKRWVPEFLDPFAYAKPIVNHEFARKRCLEVYAAALKKL